jgi:hypothetical protein
MTLRHASYDLRLTAAGLAGVAAAESLCLGLEAVSTVGLDTSG